MTRMQHADPSRSRKAPSRRRQKILLVDDEVAFTEMLRLNLELHTDYRIVVENNSANALATAKRAVPELIILDAIMPGLDGFDVLRQLEDDPATRQIPVFFLTAISRKLDFPLPSLSEVVQRKTVGKPVKLGALIREIEKAIRPDEFVESAEAVEPA